MKRTPSLIGGTEYIAVSTGAVYNMGAFKRWQFTSFGDWRWGVLENIAP